MIDRYIIVFRETNQSTRVLNEVKSVHEKLQVELRGKSVVILHEPSIDVEDMVASFNSIDIDVITTKIPVINSYWEQEWGDVWVNSLKPNDCIFNPSASIDAAHLIRSLSSLEYFPRDEFGRKYPVGSKYYLVHNLPDLTSFDLYEFVIDQALVKMTAYTDKRNIGVPLTSVLEGYEYDSVSDTSKSIQEIEKCEAEEILDKPSFNQLLENLIPSPLPPPRPQAQFEIAVARLIKSHYPDWEVVLNLELLTPGGVKAQEEDVIAYATEEGILLWISCKYTWGKSKRNRIMKEVARLSRAALTLKIPDQRIHSFVAVPHFAFLTYQEMIDEKSSPDSDVHVTHLGNLIPQIRDVLRNG
ncbi:MAG: hypothetical protein CMA23_006565 [Methanobacteriota archaeon]|nr:MAG: hypothetical protein CBE15_01490 [Euryarchaeota archaeon TMED255]RAH09014.1 MAG: hypothetical protein CMA23_006565 [Euryarchaeota archaeon]